MMKHKNSHFNFTEQEQRVFITITEKPSLVFENTAESLSKKIFTSPSALNRLAKKMGFKEYSDFKINLALKQSYKEEIVRIETNNFTSILTEQLPGLYDSVIKANNNLLSPLSSNLLFLSETLGKVRQIDIYAAGANYDICRAMSYKIPPSHVSVNVFNYVDLNYIEKVVRDKTLAIIITRTGRNPMCLYAAEQCKKNGIPTLSVSREGCLNVAENCDYFINIWFPFDGHPYKDVIQSISLGYLFDFLTFALKK